MRKERPKLTYQFPNTQLGKLIKDFVEFSSFYREALAAFNMSDSKPWPLVEQEQMERAFEDLDAFIEKHWK